MKCYYEELGVSRDANDADIKAAYRKQALRWHPDKNPTNAEEAKARFQLLQQAYEVLSDANERAWYDNHREQILRGKNSAYEDNCLDVYQYFTNTCFKGYGDDKNGFYAVYRKVFATIAAEDAEFMDDKQEFRNIPSFGDSQSNYEEVVGPFYGYWHAYTTKKSYSWLCPYDIQEIRERHILRAIDKDQKKIVQKAKKERNEEVRALVAFVRKRDKRMQAYKTYLEERAESNRLKQTQIRLQQLRERQEQLEQARQQANPVFDDNYLKQLKALNKEYGSDDNSSLEDAEQAADEIDLEDTDEASETIDLLAELYCVACNKEFKTAKAMANHEASKKHRENLERLKEQMLQEEAELTTANSDTAELVAAADEETDVASETEQEMEANIIEAVINDEDSPVEETVKSKRSKKNKNRKVQKMTGDDELLNDASNNLQHKIKATSSEEQLAVGRGSSKKARKSKKSKKANKLTEQSAEQTDDLITAMAQVKLQDTVEPVNSKQANKTTRELLEESSSEEVDTEDWVDSPNQNKTSRASKKATKTKTENAVPKIQPKYMQDLATTSSEHCCATCNASFPSKNKLFAHLKLTNHSIYLPNSATAARLAAAALEKQSKKGKGKRK